MKMKELLKAISMLVMLCISVTGCGKATGTTFNGADLKKITISPLSPSVAPGATVQLTASGIYSDGTMQDVTEFVDWSSSNELVATAGDSGLAKGVATGTATITAALGNFSDNTVLTVTSATLQSILVTPATSSIANGTKKQFTASGTYSDGTTLDITASVTWSSSDTSISTVTGGLATGLAPGSATIKATSGTIFGSATLTVTDATIKTISIEPSGPSIAAGTKKQLAAIGTFSDNSIQDITATAKWSTSNSLYATVSSSGLATGVSPGSAIITAASGSVKGSTTLTVTSGTLVSISIAPAAPSLAKGTTLQLTATGNYSDGTTQDITSSVTWSSSDTIVATVSAGGLSSGLAVGSATVKATSGTISGSATLTVTNAKLLSVSIMPALPSLAAGTTKQLAVIGTFSDTTVQDITPLATWSTSNSLVAIVSSSGLATGVGAGTATITATSGGISGTTTITVGAGSNTPPAIFSLSTSQVNVKSDNSDAATITATVLDANSVVVKDVTVVFSATSPTGAGQLSASVGTTDSNGQAKVTFKSGTVNKSNTTATIKASVSGLPDVFIPIQILGSTVSLSTTGTSLLTGAADADKPTITVTAKDAGGNPVYNTLVKLCVVDPASPDPDCQEPAPDGPLGTATLSKTSGFTDLTGKLGAGPLLSDKIIVTGTGDGNVRVKVIALGAVATQDYTVNSPENAFGITGYSGGTTTYPYEPAGLNTASSPTGNALTVTVNAPTQTSVNFATTLGTWTVGGGCTGNGTAVATCPPVLGTVTAILSSPTTGVANVEVYDATNLPATASTKDTLTVAISAEFSPTDTISLQSNVNTVPPSLGDNTYSATLTATVRTVGGQVVGGAPVAFSIDNPTGGGETVSPVIVYTGSNGEAKTTFTSGSLSSGGTGVRIIATLIGPGTNDDVNIIIGGTSGSVVIGRSTVVSENATKTAYILPMSVLVADSGGNPVSGTSITLRMWPVEYTTDGHLPPDYIYGTFPNEDVDEDLINDPGEDLNGDGELTPPNSAAGTVPVTVITDASGVANFELTYLKASSRWITARLKANAFVQGSETTSSLIFVLPATLEDIAAGVLPPSPYLAPVGWGTILLSGAAGSTVTQPLSPTFGTGPYTFSAVLGTMTPGSGGSSTYSYTIPGGAISGSVITDTIYITDSLLVTRTINVAITVL